MDTESLYDIVVIGGGIQGTGIAADAQGRGLRVLLCEQNDLASATSSASSKLIHGGLRYLENYHFRLVREALKEREILLQTAPHLVKPLRFVMPFEAQRRPFWLLRLGIFCYDLMGYARFFKRSKMIHFDAQDPTNPLKRSLKKGFIYSDATVDDARLTITTALRAARAGCKVLNYTKCISAQRIDNLWHVTLQDTLTQKKWTVQCKAIVNAAGPWVNEVNKNVLHHQSNFQIRLVKGSHIVVPKLYARETAYVLQHKDGRIVFVIPYLKQFTLIGTTDIPFQGSPSSPKIDLDEIEYLCDLVSHYFHHPLKQEQIQYAWSGVRTLVEEKSATLAANTREYKLELATNKENTLPLLSVLGGKLTTYRSVAEKAVNMLAPFFPQCGKPWTAHQPLPGGDLRDNMTAFLETLAHDYAWLPSLLAVRYAQHYGTLTYTLLGQAKNIEDLGQYFGYGLYEKELIYLVQKEWAKNSQDVLWRRTKLGLFLTTKEQENVQRWFDLHPPATPQFSPHP